jgi:hypothetical protein
MKILLPPLLLLLAPLVPALPEQASERAKKVFDFWTAERIASAVPLDIVCGHGPNDCTYYDASAAIDGGWRRRKLQGVVPDAAWDQGGDVMEAAGRLLFAMDGGFYVCSGTAVTDDTIGRSIILTAAHCVYDDSNKAFATQAMFIPMQDDGGIDGTDFDCTNDYYGCWAPEFGVVDADWTTRTFPDNIPWDYAFYVVNDNDLDRVGFVLDDTVATLPLGFDAINGDFTHAFGYSYDQDPDFRYCAENLAAESSYGGWWLGSCQMTGGSSGGPWVQPFDAGTGTGTGPIISVNSWGYRGEDGMAGPKLSGNSASCVFDIAKTVVLGSACNGGRIVTYDADATTCEAIKIEFCCQPNGGECSINGDCCSNKCKGKSGNKKCR